jgi:N-acetylglucosamine kinase-like BadF-type ATPase
MRFFRRSTPLKEASDTTVKSILGTLDSIRETQKLLDERIDILNQRLDQHVKNLLDVATNNKSVIEAVGKIAMQIERLAKLSNETANRIVTLEGDMQEVKTFGSSVIGDKIN